jgi:predicted Holliday junction resolvase-like endonuclease
MKPWLVTGCAVVLVAATLTAVAAEKKHTKKLAPKKVEHLTCMLGDEDRQARVAVEIIGGRIQSFAYYSKKKPQTCSVHLQRDEVYSKWTDEGRFTKVTTENGNFLFENKPKDVHFLFTDVDRMAYCGMEIGKINGSVTVIRGKKECIVEQLMDAHEEP